MKNWLMRPVSATQVTNLQRLWLYAFGVLALVFLLLPSLIVVPMSFSDSRYLEFPPETWSLRWYRNYLDSPVWMDATRVSFVVAIASALIATPIGTAAAYGLHVTGFRINPVLRVVLMTPIMVPVILIAIGVFFLYAKLGLNNTYTGLILANVMLALPFVMINAAAGLSSFDLNQELVARSLGASRLTAFLTVTLPQIRFSILSGALFTFIIALDEVVVALFISSGERATLTRRMFLALRDEIDPTIAAISTLLIGLSIILLVLSQLLNRSPPGE